MSSEAPVQPRGRDVVDERDQLKYTAGDMLYPPVEAAKEQTDAVSDWFDEVFPEMVESVEEQTRALLFSGGYGMDQLKDRFMEAVFAHNKTLTAGEKVLAVITRMVKDPAYLRKMVADLPSSGVGPSKRERVAALKQIAGDLFDNMDPDQPLTVFRVSLREPAEPDSGNFVDSSAKLQH